MRQPRNHGSSQSVDAETLASDVAQHMAFRPEEIAAGDRVLFHHALGGQRRQDTVHGRLAHSGIACQRQQARAFAAHARYTTQHQHGPRNRLSATDLR
ncbi:hypothetical protein D9M68_817180 [compost metagenome]